MLDDRPYMREWGGRRTLSVTSALMITNGVVFVVQSALEFYTGFPVTRLLGLSVGGLASGQVWQLLTFQFLHGGFLHLLLNLVAIYFFGRAIEDALGSKPMLTLYLTSGSVGGLCQVALAFLAPAYFGGVVVGASAGAFGLVAAFATLFPDRRLTLLVFFVIPVSMRARTLLWISIALAVFGILVPNGTVADAAHLGGILTGCLFIRIQGRGFSWSWRPAPLFRRRPRILVHAGPRGPQPPPRPEADPGMTEDFIGREVDPILEKISAHGIQSLTDRERRILESARNRMQRR